MSSLSLHASPYSLFLIDSLGLQHLYRIYFNALSLTLTALIVETSHWNRFNFFKHAGYYFEIYLFICFAVFTISNTRSLHLYDYICMGLPFQTVFFLKLCFLFSFLIKFVK